MKTWLDRWLECMICESCKEEKKRTVVVEAKKPVASETVGTAGTVKTIEKQK